MRVTGLPSHIYHLFNIEENLVPIEMAFVIIVLLLISLSCGFSIYSLYHPRYMFKRVASGLHLLTAVMLIVLVSHHHDEFKGMAIWVAL